MFSTKMSLITICAIAFTISGCNTQKSSLTPEEVVRVESQKTLPKSLQIKVDTYNVHVECVDEAKTEKLKNLHWVVKIKEDGYFQSSQQNFDANCEDACSLVEAGAFKANDVSAVFTVTRKMNDKYEFEAVSEPTTKTYVVMSYEDRFFTKLVLVDNTQENVCQGKMLLTLQN